MNELKAKYSLTDKYILFVGTLQPRKNISRLIEAFSILSKKRAFSDIELVIVGKKGWSYEEILQAPKKFAVSDRVKFLDFVPDDDLPFLYQHAQCFVLPSLYEGFGLPVLEAMKYNCPVITSNVSSLPEAGGDAAVYIDPLSVSDIAEKLEKVLSDRNLRNTMIERGRKQIQKFSWEKAAKETLKILEKVYQQKV
jgi:glycosyltransferase involved in cell wall biosynthesis